MTYGVYRIINLRNGKGCIRSSKNSDANKRQIKVLAKLCAGRPAWNKGLKFSGSTTSYKNLIRGKK